jgi:hypothetical protein
MVKKYFAMAALLTGMLPVAAQDTYENARLLGADLNGTARYVGMGGALEALGADISTMSTNPAGIGLFRHSTLSLSAGMLMQQDANKFDNLGTNNLSFDQIGFVYVAEMDNSYINFGFNYHKSRNFDQILSAANNQMRAASMSKLAFAKSTKESDRAGGYYWDTNNSGEIIGWRDIDSDERAYPFTQWDYLYFNTIGYDADAKEALFVEAEPGGGRDAYTFDRAHRGWIADFDLNMSGNIHDRVFLGLTVGLHSVRYKGYSEYSENIVDAGGTARGDLTLCDDRKITGTGVDVKLGAIFRPFEDSPFRIGLSLSTPTWYDLKSQNVTALFNNTDRSWNNWGYSKGENSEVYEFKYYTPWKFGLSLGHTISNMLALGASYEYTDCGSADTRVNDGYDYYGNEDSYSDRVMNDNTDYSLKGVHTLKLGAELKPSPEFAVRLGYNYVSSMYNKNGFRNSQLDSPGNMYASTADYCNWEDTQRITCGLGYKYERMNIDLAYQYSTTDGSFYPFQPNVVFDDPAGNRGVTCISSPTSVSNKRHQLLLTLGYTF